MQLILKISNTSILLSCKFSSKKKSDTYSKDEIILQNRVHMRMTEVLKGDINLMKAKENKIQSGTQIENPIEGLFKAK